MPHLVMLYTPNLEKETDIDVLCTKLAEAMRVALDDGGANVFPTGGIRVLAYPAAHYAVADGKRDYAFAYLNLRMAKGRSDTVKQSVGESLVATAKAHFEPQLAKRYIGITIQIDEGHEVFDSKQSTIHPLFTKK